MPRPTTKEDLIFASNEQFEKLWNLIDGMTEKERTADINPNERDKNVRDVLVHLYEWHCLLLNWIKSNTQGKSAAFLPEPYNWKTYPEMNVEFWKKHQNTNLEEAKEMLKQSHKKVLDLADTFTNEELFSKDVYKWVGGSVLGSYFVSATSSHYDWAMKKLKAHQKNCKLK